MSQALPRRCYRDPAEQIEREEAHEVYRRESCAACRWWDMRRGDDACYKRLLPQPSWCRGFEER